MVIYSAIILTLIVIAMDKGTDVLGLLLLLPIFGRVFGWW